MPDSRITKQAFAQAIKELMEVKPLAKISVGDVTERCGMKRQTFYYHFKDKYDLVNWIYLTEATQYMSQLTDREHWADGLCALCAYMRENRKFYLNALDTFGQNSFPEYLTQLLRELMLLLIKEVPAGAQLDRKTQETLADFNAFGFVGLIVQWAKGGMREDPQSFIDSIQKIVDERLLL